MPEGVVYVGRPTRWGNPFRVDANHDAASCVRDFRQYVLSRLHSGIGYPLRELVGRDLACCRLGEPCHADVLLELANKKFNER
jgi:hypothetical protein